MASYENENVNVRIQELSGSGYEIVKGEPDIRGWEVKDPQGRIFGKVDELLFDIEDQRVRYIVLNLKDNVLHLASRKVLMPIGLAELHQENDDVILPEITAVHLTELPDYKKGHLSHGHELLVRKVFGGLGGGAVGAMAPAEPDAADDRNFYQHQHFNEENFYHRRPAPEGTSDLSSRSNEMTPPPASAPANEIDSGSRRMNLQRNPEDRSVGSGGLGAFQEGTIEISGQKEVPVVTKDARVVEEVKVNKGIEEREATIKDTVRRTDVDIERDRLDSDTSSDDRQV